MTRWSLPRDGCRRASARLDVAYADSYPTLVALAGRHLADPLAAHDAAVEAMAAVWDGGLAVPDAAARRAWLGRMTERADGPGAPGGPSEPGVLSGPEGESGPRAALAGLRQADADLVRMTVAEGRDPAEVARVLGCSERAVQVRLQRARVRLRHDLRRADERITLAAATRSRRSPTSDDHSS